MNAFTIVRVSAQDQLRGYGADVQWEDDVLMNAPLLGLQPSVEHRRIIQEAATDWDRRLFEATVREGLSLYHNGEVQAMLFPRVDRETRFVFGSFPLLAEVVQNGMSVFFARDRLRLDPMDPESVERYFNKAIQAQAYVTTMRENVMGALRKRAEKDHRMPTGGNKWAHDYHHYRSFQKPEAASGRYTINRERADWVRKWKDWLLYDGVSLKEIERRFEVSTGVRLNRATLLRVLKDKALIGEFYAYRHKLVRDSQGKKHRVTVPESEHILVYVDKSQAILNDEEFYAIRRQLDFNRKNSPRNTKYHYPPLKGLVLCEPCQLRMQALTTNFGTAYYRCPSCHNHINATRLWQEIKNHLSNLVLEPKRLIIAIQANFDNGKSAARLEQELASLERERKGWEQSRVKQRRLYLLPDSKYSERDYLEDDRRIQVQLQTVNNKITEAERQMAEVRQARLDEEGIRHFCEIAANNLANMGDSRWRLLVEAMHLRVKVLGKNARVKGAIPITQDDIALQPSRR